MTDEDRGFSLKRWSARKLDAARALQETPAPPPVPDVPALAVAAPVDAAPVAQAASEPSLPPVETLTFGSDFAAFMKPKVAEAVKRQALKKLFADPHFNVMDGLDVYIDDYSIPSPLEPELVSELWHARSTLNPPRTRINAAGHAEDVPPGEEEQVVASAGSAVGPPDDSASPPGVEGVDPITAGPHAEPADAGARAASQAPPAGAGSTPGQAAAGPEAPVAGSAAGPAGPPDSDAGKT